MKRLLMIIFMDNTKAYLTKEMCAYPYYLGKNYGWFCTYAYFTNKEPLKNAQFEKYCALKYLGKALDYKKQKKIAAEYLQQCARDLDILCFFHYGGASYSLARLAKRLNPKIKVYIKLDMNENGFSHFYDGTFWRKLKILPEYWKSRAVDLFTVENRSFYNILKKMRLFRNRIEYLPNAVSLFGVDEEKILRTKQKDNILLTVGRLGTHIKNTELLVEAMRKVDRELFNDWKLLLIGSATVHFIEYIKQLYQSDAWLKDHILLAGEISDRQKLYELYKKAKIICMTSRSESFCIAVLEAMYFGAYPILTDFGRVVQDITAHGHHGTIVAQDDVKMLAKTLEKLVQDERLDNMNLAVARFARENFSYDVWTRNLDEYFTRLCTQ